MKRPYFSAIYWLINKNIDLLMKNLSLNMIISFKAQYIYIYIFIFSAILRLILLDSLKARVVRNRVE